ncbi:MAG: glycoside hydrolase family 16 protein [Bacteroidales bacterium]
MASIKLLLGMVPATSKIEQEEKALIAEFEKLNSFSESKQLARYNELNSLVNSAGFVQKKKEIESLQYKNSEECSREKEFKSLQKARDLVMYFRTVSGSALKKFRELEGSDKISKYEELKRLVQEAGFREKMKSKEFSGSDDAKKLAEFKQLDSSVEIKDFFKFRDSKEYANFKNIDGSSRLARHNELKDYTASKEFAEKKAYLLDKKRFEKTEEYKELAEFEKLKKDPDIIWYLKVKDSNKFDVLKNRELLFSEEFDGDKLDTGKWLTNYYWGEKLLNDRYSIDTDLQYYTEKDNFEVRNSYLKINTKQQKINGKAWSAASGFTTKEFSYTSGLVNTGKSFRQKYGVFTAKIKLGDPSARNSFWLLGEKAAPLVSICRTTGGKVWFDCIGSNGKTSSTRLGAKYTGDSFIFTLEWTSSSLTWKINGVEVFVQTENVPQEPMYINLAGGVTKPISGMTSMEIDWIRVYNVKK